LNPRTPKGQEFCSNAEIQREEFSNILSVAGLQIHLEMQTTCAFDQAGRPPR